ncbi:MAG: hypothetical protein MZV64_20160 [Ignavibacteriales bacterium]|nr:hypothetical protein [Ignavibacteriales bacterium]
MLTKRFLYSIISVLISIQPLIYDGFIEDEFVVCPAHGWMFNLESGKTPTGGRGLEAYESTIVEGEVYVKVEEKKYSW